MRKHVDLIELYANPYAGGPGFYFSDLEGWLKGMLACEARGIEEVEIEVIDGQPWAVAVAVAAEPSQTEVPLLLRMLEEIESERSDRVSLELAAAAFYALKYENRRIAELVDREALERIVADKGIRFDTTAEDVVSEYAEEGLLSEDTYETYFDWDRYGGDIADDVTSAEVEVARENAESDEEADAEEERVRAEYERMSDTEIAEEFVSSMGKLTDAVPTRAMAKKMRGYYGPVLEDYLNIEALARDMQINGELEEFEFAGTMAVATSPQG